MNSHPSEQPSKQLKWRALVSAVLLFLLVPGVTYYSNNNTYVAAYFRKDPGSTIIILQVWSAFETTMSCLSMKISQHFGFRLSSWAAYMGLALLNLIVSFIEEPYAFIFIYSTFAGTFSGLGYLQGLYIAWTYWPDKKSLVTGVIFFSYAIAGSIFSPVSTAIVNPDGLKFGDPKFGDRVPLLFRVYAIIYAVIAFVACLLLPKPWESPHLREKKEAQLVLKNLSHVDQNHLKAAQAVLERGKSSVVFEGKQISSLELEIVHKHELFQEVGATGCGQQALLINFMVADRAQDLIVDNMKFHLLNETHHPHIKTWRNRHPTIHGGSMNDSLHPNGPDALRSNGQVSNPERDSKAIRRVIEHDSKVIYEELQQIKKRDCGSLRQGIFSWSFWLIFYMTFSCGLFTFFVFSNWKDYFLVVFAKEAVVASDNSLSLMLTFAGVGSAVSRVVVGALQIKVKLRYLLMFQNSVMAFLAFSFKGLMKSYGMGVFYIVMVQFIFGVQITLLPSLAVEVFGSNIGTQLYPVFFFCFTFASFGQYFLYAYYGKTDASGMMFYLFGSMTCLGLLVSVFLNLDPKWKDKVSPKELPEQMPLPINQASYHPKKPQTHAHQPLNTEHDPEYGNRLDTLQTDRKPLKGEPINFMEGQLGGSDRAIKHASIANT